VGLHHSSLRAQANIKIWFYVTVFLGLEYHYVIHFNSSNIYGGLKQKADSADGCVVERKCPNCKNDKMSYATLQLRSADEGQTVFYTCTKCK
jgi:DNA-directed RNA polymerase I subunit RPA12